MITRRGIGLTVVAVAVFFLASTTRVGWVHLADAVLWGVILLSLAVPWLSAPGLKVVRRVESSAPDGLSGPVEGDAARVTLELHNSWWLPRALICISYPHTAPGAETTDRSVFLWLWPRAKRSLDSAPMLDRRGQHVFGGMTVEIAGPFGLFRRRKRVEARNAVLVHPRWEPVQRLGALESAAGDSSGMRRSRTGTETAGTRPYAPGDAYRSIHWRNSARTGRITVREFDAWSHRPLVMAVDNVNVLGSAPESTLDYAARMAASLALVTERESGAVSLLTGSGELPDFLAWTAVMEQLAKLEPQERGGNLARSIADIEPGRRLVAFLSPSSAAEAAAVRSAAQRGVAVAAVVFSGFDEAAHGAADMAKSLEQSGAHVVVCERGGMKSALRALEGGAAGATSSRRSPAASHRRAA